MRNEGQVEEELISEWSRRWRRNGVQDGQECEGVMEVSMFQKVEKNGNQDVQEDCGGMEVIMVMSTVQAFLKGLGEEQGRGCSVCNRDTDQLYQTQPCCAQVQGRLEHNFNNVQTQIQNQFKVGKG